jgi:hypothetical protein
MTRKTSELQITAGQADQLMTTQIVTRYGPICFSYAPKGIDLGISNLVASLLDAADPEATSVDLDISERTRRLLMNSAKIYHAQELKTFPNDAIERFSQTARGYSQGTLEQFIDNLPAAVTLMMDYLAIAALTPGQTNEGTESSLPIEEKRRTLRRILRDQFSEAK